MAKIEIGRYSAQLRRMFSMKGQDVVAGELSPEISPTVELGGNGPEWHFLRDDRIQICNIEQAPVVGQPSSWRMVNPATSNIVAVVEGIDWNVTQDTEQDLTLDTVLTPLAQPSFPIIRDTRWANLNTVPPTVSMSPLVFSSGGVTVTGSILWHARLVPTTINHQELNFVLGPGFSLNGGNGNDNLRVVWTIYWRERRLPPIER